MEKETTAKRTMKDSVFCDMFGRKEYAKQLYESLFPGDTISEDEIDIVTLEKVMVNGQYNDLGLLAKNKFTVLAEAQSTWSYNIVMRFLLYIAEEYKKILTRKDKLALFKPQKVHIPEPKFFVIYTGNKKDIRSRISLSEEFFGGSDVLDLKVDVIRDTEKNNIVSQYITFCKIADSVIKEHGRTEDAVKKIIEICVENNILKNYISSRKVEVEKMLGMTITQREAEELIREEGRVEGREEGKAEGRVEGRAEGKAEGKAEGIVQTFKELGQSIDKAIDNLIKKLSLSHDEAEKLAKQYWK